MHHQQVLSARCENQSGSFHMENPLKTLEVHSQQMESAMKTTPLRESHLANTHGGLSTSPVLPQRHVTPPLSSVKKAPPKRQTKFRADQSQQWNQRYHELCLYKELHGHCNVPRTLLQNPQLGTWINTQRKQYRLLKLGQHSQMTPHRIVQLETLGFSWTKCGKSDWGVRFQELKNFKEQKGHCLVPQRYGPNPQLGTWVNNQRTQFKTWQEDGLGPMSHERANMLVGLGFSWNVCKDNAQKKRNLAKKDESLWNEEFTQSNRRRPNETPSLEALLSATQQAGFLEENKENLSHNAEFQVNKQYYPIVDAATRAAAAVLLEL
jgi:hypothetical protein